MMKLAKELTTANSLVNDPESEDEAVLLTHNREYWNASLSVVCRRLSSSVVCRRE